MDRRYAELRGILHLPWHSAAYALTSTCCAQLARAVTAGANVTSIQYHAEARHRLEGLHFALRAQPRPGHLARGEFGPSWSAQRIDKHKLALAVGVLDECEAYAHVRDALISFWHGVFCARLMDRRTIRFDLGPEWQGGARHVADRAISRALDGAELRHVVSLPTLEDVKARLMRDTMLPRDLDLSGIDSGLFAAVHYHVCGQLAGSLIDGLAPILQKNDIVALARGCAGLNQSKAQRYMELITYDPGDTKPHVDLFCCPLLHLTEDSYQLVTPALLLANLRYVVPRLAVHRGPGLDAYSERMESHIMNLLEEHFRASGVVMKARFTYKSVDDEGDIDFVLYDAGHRVIVLAQIKAFVPPDSVMDVLDVNEKLAQGIVQAERARAWFTSPKGRELCTYLGVSDHSAVRRVIYAVIGNGVIGSDYLSVPADITMLTSDFLLQKRYRGGSFATAVDDFAARMRQEADAASRAVEYLTDTFGGWRFEMCASPS